MIKKNLFVYGILRPAYINYNTDLYESHQPATAPGRIYHAHPSGRTYPVAKLDEDGTIHGDLLVVDILSDEFDHVYQMERYAGYELAEDIKVTLEDGSVVDAFAFHYMGTPRGPRIESGDWLKHDA